MFSTEVGFPRRRKIKQDQFVIFNQQFLTLIHAGLPIIQSLELLVKRQRNLFFRSVLQNVRDRVRGGELLSEAFEAQRVFPKVYTTTLLAGEKSGNLEEVMGRYISFQRVAVSFRKKVVASLVYPILLVVVLVVMLTFPHHLCGSTVCHSVLAVGSTAAARDLSNAVDWCQCQAVFPADTSGTGRHRVLRVALDEE